MLEYPRIARLHHWSRATIREFVAELAYLGIMTPGEITLNVVRTDPADNRYLECALEGAADYVVSGDQDLLDLHEHSGIRIVRDDPLAPSASFPGRLRGGGAADCRGRRRSPSAGGDLIGLWGCRGVRRAAVRETATEQSDLAQIALP